MSPRHILVVNVFFAPFSYGGATVVAEQVARALVRQGSCEVTAVSLCARDDLAPYAVIKCHKDGIDNYLINVPGGRNAVEMYDNPAVTRCLADLVASLRPDVIHAHCLQEIGTGIFAVAEASDTPVILSIHDFWWICERQFMIRMDETYCGQDPVRIENCRGCVSNYKAAQTRFEHLREMGAKATVVTYPSSFARDLCEKSGFTPGNGIIWENGVLPPGEDFFARQSERRAADGRICFGYLGGPSQIKGWPIIRRALSNMDRQDFRGLVVEGSLDGSWWLEKDLRGLKGDWEIYPRYSQAQMDDFYAEIDVLLFMSQWKETYGLAIREALSRGISVIQTDSGGTVEHGEVPKEDLIPIGAPAECLQQRIEGIIGSGKRGRAPVRVTSFDDQARAFVDLVDQVLGHSERAA